MNNKVNHHETPHFNRSLLGDTCHLPNSVQIHRSPVIGDARGASLLHVAVKRQALPVILELLRHRAEVPGGCNIHPQGGTEGYWDVVAVVVVVVVVVVVNARSIGSQSLR